MKNYTNDLDPSKYHFHLFNDLPDDPTRYIGIVGHADNPKVRVRICVDDEYVIKHKSSLCVFYQDFDDYLSKSEVVITKQMRDGILVNQDSFIAALWHEIGHFHTLPSYNSFGTKKLTEDVFMARRIAFKAGVIQPEEKAADEFAVLHCGVDAVVAMLNMGIRRRKVINDPYAEDAIEEFLRRKRHIRRQPREASCQDNDAVMDVNS